MHGRVSVAAGLALLAVSSGLRAQQATPFTIAQAVENALRNYPSIRVSQEQLNAASAAIQLARTAYLPRIDAFAQANRASRNNVLGLVLPQSSIPSISGPVLGTNNLDTAWGSAVGMLITWEPFDFGLRHAGVSTAASAKRYSEAVEKRTQFDVATATADAYLTLAAAQETVRAAQAAVDRSETLARITKALVDAQLRPGADASRAEAELAAARTQLIQARQATDIARATVAQFVGGEPSQIAMAAPKFSGLPPDQKPSGVDTSLHPVSAEQNAAVEQAKAQLRVLEKSYFPHFYLQGSAYGRGTGAETDGRLLGGLNGLGPNVQNYAVGFSVTFPVFDLASIRAREAGQSATIRAETARYQQIVTDLKAQWNKATATLEGSRQVAENTPVQVSAARTTTQQATARYQSGLGNVVDVAEAQRLLTQAEIDDALARLGVWRALLGVATAAGDIRPFLAEASH
jgi:outer membrane protein TolC